MEDQEPLMERPPEVNFQRRGLIAVLLALVAGASLALCPMASEPRLRQQAAELPGEIVAEAEEGGFKTETNTNHGNQAAHDVIVKKQTVIQKIYQATPKNAPQVSECTVVKATDDKITFHGSGDGGTYIIYTYPKYFVGKFYINHKPVTNVKDLPQCLTTLWLKDGDVGGRLSDLPKALTNLSLPGIFGQQFKHFTGDVRDLPPMLKYLDLQWTSEGITGNLRDLPPGLVHLNLDLASKITGGLSHLPRNLRFVNLRRANVHGSTWQLPRSLTWADFEAATNIHGDVKGLPRDLTDAYFYSANLTGQMQDLPQHLTHAAFWYSKGIEGHLSQIPNPNHLLCQRKSEADGGGLSCLWILCFGKNIEGHLSEIPTRSAGARENRMRMVVDLSLVWPGPHKTKDSLHFLFWPCSHFVVWDVQWRAVLAYHKNRWLSFLNSPVSQLAATPSQREGVM